MRWVYKFIKMLDFQNKTNRLLNELQIDWVANAPLLECLIFTCSVTKDAQKITERNFCTFSRICHHGRSFWTAQVQPKKSKSNTKNQPQKNYPKSNPTPNLRWVLSGSISKTHRKSKTEVIVEFVLMSHGWSWNWTRKHSPLGVGLLFGAVFGLNVELLLIFFVPVLFKTNEHDDEFNYKFCLWFPVCLWNWTRKHSL